MAAVSAVLLALGLGSATPVSRTAGVEKKSGWVVTAVPFTLLVGVRRSDIGTDSGFRGRLEYPLKVLIRIRASS
jgi:hypothetical protein